MNRCKPLALLLPLLLLLAASCTCNRIPTPKPTTANRQKPISGRFLLKVFY